jgi:rSAM/selenodomain-associated transferase 2
MSSLDSGSALVADANILERPLRVSVIVPALNEETAIGDTICSIRAVKEVFEVIVVDGGSSDATTTIARNSGAKVITAPRGRGSQLRIGAQHASGDILWFIHADTHPQEDAVKDIRCALARPCAIGGYFRSRFTGTTWGAYVSTWGYFVLRAIGIVWGDCAIFVRRDAYNDFGGVPDLPLFEDAELVCRIRQHGRLIGVPKWVTTSSRRFETRSYVATLLQWVGLHLLYWAGVSPEHLVTLYKDIR